MGDAGKIMDRCRTDLFRRVHRGHHDASSSPLPHGSTIGTTNLSQSLTLDRDTSAVIAALKVGVDKDFGMFKAGIFARGEVLRALDAVQRRGSVRRRRRWRQQQWHKHRSGRCLDSLCWRTRDGPIELTT